MARLEKPIDFSVLLEKYADSPLISRGGSNSDRERSNSGPSRHDIIRERLSNRFRRTYHDRTRTYDLRESEIFTLGELGKFRVISAGKLHELSKADLVALHKGKAKFNRREIANLYQRWSAEQVHFGQVRKECESLRRPETVVFIFTPVNGQVALFERHPNSWVKTPWKSTRKEPFAGDFTPSVT